MSKRPYKNTHAFLRPLSVRQRRWSQVIKSILLSLLLLLALIIMGFLVVFYSPLFPSVRTQYILMTIHTSNPWLATAFFSETDINKVLEDNRVEAPDQHTNTDLIQIPIKTTGSADTTATTSSAAGATNATASVSTQTKTTSTRRPATNAPTNPSFTPKPAEVIYDQDGVIIHQIQGDTYVARMVMVKDPSRVRLALSNRFLTFGEKLVNMCKRTDALVGINAGGFQDPKGSGNGGTPTFLCVKDYKIVYKDSAAKHHVIGINENNVLVLGEFTNQEILNNRIRDAVSFKPFLIVNGVAAKTYGAAGGKDPRSAIGQRLDGTMLLLTIDGRQAGIEGGNMRTILELMLQYEAFNAANLDGGSSTTMVLNGTIINKPCSLYGPRYLPNAWIVTK